MCDYPFEIISASSSVTQAFAIDNSIIKARNVDTLPPTEIALHAHPYYSLVFVDDCDSFTTYIDGCPIEYLPGYAYFNPPDTLHSPKNRFSGMFSSISLKIYIQDDDFAARFGNLPFCTKCDKALKGLFVNNAKLAKSFDSLTLPLLYENSKKILETLINAPKTVISPKGDGYDSLFINVLKFMYANCNRDIDLEELANVAHMERTAFAKKFKSMYKITPINYLYSIRLSRSLDLLMSYDLPITSIAQMIGFKRSTAFASSFARTFGMTPTEYRYRLFNREIPLVIHKRD